MKNLIHIYTGDGKGKTTSSIGLIIRALGHNKKVVYITFGKRECNYGEFKVLKKLKVPIFTFASEYPCFVKKVNVKKLKSECVKGIKKIFSLYKKNYGLIVIDELLVTVRDKFLSIEKLKQVINKKPQNTEIVITGRSDKFILEQIKNYVDYITIMKKIKHPYDIGINGREGVEY
jgi:cob(I)alamin adenosyltransferase